MHDLFVEMRQRETGKYEVSVSYMEVYNEQIRDLLSPSPTASPLQLREERDGSMTIAGLSSHTPSSAAEVFRMLERGNQRRTQSATEANAQSSRSHAVLQVTLRRRDLEAGKTASRVRLAKLSLIDLAGSERAAVSKNRGQTLKEGANINRSLLALGNCINQLAARSKHSSVSTDANAAADPTHKPQPRTPRRTQHSNHRGKENKQPSLLHHQQQHLYHYHTRRTSLLLRPLPRQQAHSAAEGQPGRQLPDCYDSQCEPVGAVE